ncbi:DNA-binding protein SMUBP-2-like protein [Corchorus olitorius]|uniref:DNA-binding protein SMUBP-2-like protein n=1 Tax=Corchorus olitorius TaxID=93759 RepID=A0A1R3KTK6_9ROSI|nr:DNA-binding protein SMUBP-2-like protein [Corchorus olitorius]
MARSNQVGAKAKELERLVFHQAKLDGRTFKEVVMKNGQTSLNQGNNVGRKVVTAVWNETKPIQGNPKNKEVIVATEKSAEGGSSSSLNFNQMLVVENEGERLPSRSTTEELDLDFELPSEDMEWLGRSIVGRLNPNANVEQKLRADGEGKWRRNNFSFKVSVDDKFSDDRNSDCGVFDEPLEDEENSNDVCSCPGEILGELVSVALVNEDVINDESEDIVLETMCMERNVETSKIDDKAKHETQRIGECQTHGDHLRKLVMVVELSWTKIRNNALKKLGQSLHSPQH